MAKLSTDELIDAFKELTLLELSEFVKQFETTYRGRSGRGCRRTRRGRSGRGRGRAG